MELRQLEYVVAVVEHGSFRAASEAVGVAPPSLSQGIKALEAQLGVTLFHRLARGVRLSDAGEAIVPAARQALRAAGVVRDTALDVAGLRTGRLDVVCLGTLSVDPGAGLVGRFRRRNPEVSVHLTLPETVADVAERIRDGASEVGLAELLPEDDDLEVHELARQDFVALVSATEGRGHHRDQRLTIRQLSRMPLIVTPPGTSTRRQVELAFAEAGLTIDVAVETEHREAMVALVAAGAGVAVVPRPAPERVPAGTVACAITPKLVRRIGLVHRRAPLSPAAQGFLALAVTGEPARVHRPRPRRSVTGR